MKTLCSILVALAAASCSPVREVCSGVGEPAPVHGYETEDGTVVVFSGDAPDGDGYSGRSTAR